MNGSRVKKIRKEISSQNKQYASDIYKSVSDASISALFLMPFKKRVSFAMGLVFYPILKGK